MLFNEYSHKRYNPLTGDWVLVSPHRTKRPWKGSIEKQPGENRPEYDHGCYLCPGNERAGGEKNPDYESVFTFTNDFSALMSDIPTNSINEKDILISATERGICKVICFSPRHDLTLAEMNQEMIAPVIDEWIKQYIQLGSRDYIQYVQIFENKGAIMGCSNPHPHGQIWSNESIPFLPMLEQIKQSEYLKKNNSCLLCNYLEIELDKKERILYENESFVCLVPFWAVWPYETMVLPKEHLRNITEMKKKVKVDFADIISHITIKYDNIFETSFPYSMGIHQSPVDNQEHDEWHFHVHFFPPLLRSATIKKFMVGYEMLGMPQRDITAEQAALQISQLSDIHYKNK